MENADFDFIGHSSEIENFGRNNMLPEKMIRNLVLVFEEIVLQGISVRENVFPIDVTVESSEAEGSSTIEVVYGGSRFDPVTDGDQISASIVKGVSSATDFSYESGMNRFSSVVKG